MAQTAMPATPDADRITTPAINVVAVAGQPRRLELSGAWNLRGLELNLAQLRQKLAEHAGETGIAWDLRGIERLDHAGAMRWLARSHVMVISSLMEGGAHVVSEAIATGVPVIASAIPGNLGLLGDDYPARYPVGDEKALAAMLRRARSDSAWLKTLQSAIGKRRALVLPAAERCALKDLLAELIGSCAMRE